MQILETLKTRTKTYAINIYYILYLSSYMHCIISSSSQCKIDK